MDVPRFSPVQIDHQTEQGFQTRSDSIAQRFESLIGLVRRQFLLIAVITALAMGLGVVNLMTAQPIYTAHAKLLIDSGKVRALQQQALPGSFLPFSFTEIMTQVEILKSDSIALTVVKSLHLTDNPAFIGGTEARGGAAVFAWVKGLFGSRILKSPDTRSQTELTSAALGTFQAQRSVTRVVETYVLDVGYTAHDPNLAEKMANALADAYIDDQLDSKYQTERRANSWLQDRIKELRSQAAEADFAVLEYKKNNKIVDLGGGINNQNGRLLGDEQVTQLNAQVISARGSLGEAKARLERINEIMQEDVPDAGTVDTLQSGVITGLRTKYLDLAARERIFSERYGANHLAVVNLRTQMNELRRSIADELNRIAQSYKSDYEIASVRVKSLETNLASLISKSQLTNRDRIGLGDLETTAKVYHSIYDNFLNRFMEATQQQSFPITEARVISRAEPGFKSGPNAQKVMTLAGFLGLILGLAAGFLRESLDRVFRTRHQVEDILRSNCLAILPRLVPVAATMGAGDEAQAGSGLGTSARKLITDKGGFFTRVLDEPRSSFAEGFRSIKVAADIASAIKENKIIGIISTVPKEGKSTIASNLAELMAHAGKRVMLVDGDLRNRTLSRVLARGATTGLLEVLAGQINLQEVVYTDDRSNLTFLPALVESRLAHTDEILASTGFKQLLQRLRSNYDYIIVDLPPLAPVSDARATTGIIDSYIFVIEWGRTKISAVQHQLAAAHELYDRLLGVVLSKADVKALARYEQYYGRDYYKNYDSRYGYGS